MPIESLGGISDKAVRKSTGIGWSQWVEILDRAGLKAKPHKEIVQWLWDNGYAGKGGQPLNGWWAQSVTVGYEYHHGRRVKGQTAAAGFEVGVQKTIPAPIESVWSFLVSDEGLAIWLGGNLDQVSIEKGHRYELTDGSTGQIRAVYPEQKLRLTWQPSGRKSPTTLQLYLACPGGDKQKTSLRFHHEKLEDNREREEMRQRWRSVLEKLQRAITNGE